MVQKQNPRNVPNTKETAPKSENVVTFVDNKNKNNKDHNKSHKRNQILVTIRKTQLLKMILQLKFRLVI